MHCHYCHEEMNSAFMLSAKQGRVLLCNKCSHDAKVWVHYSSVRVRVCDICKNEIPKKEHFFKLDDLDACDYCHLRSLEVSA